MLAKTPTPLKWLYPRRLWKLPPGDKKELFLTFDDGPIPEVTPWVLDQLRIYNASATFFCIGDNVRKHPAQFQRILEENHVVGNHTFHHLNGWKTPKQAYLENTLEAEKTMASFGKTSAGPKLFRPPYGRVSFQQAKALGALGYSLVMWDVLSMDYDPFISPQKCFENIVSHGKPGSIIVLHDSLKAEGNLREVLPRILEYFSEKGYRFEAIRHIPEGFR